MLLLFKAAFRHSKHFALLIGSVVFMLLLSLADLLEMFALATLVNGSPLSSNAAPSGIKSDLISRTSSFLKESLSLSNAVEFTICMVVFIALFKAVTLFFSRYFSQLTAIHVNRDLREGYFKHIQTLSLSFYSEYDVGVLSSRVVADSQQITLSLNSALTNYILVPFTICMSLGACIMVSWKLSSLIFLCMPLVIFPTRYLLKRVKKNSHLFFRNQEGFTSVLIDFLAGIHTIKTFVAESFSFKKYSQQNTEMARIEAKTAKYSLMIRPFLHMVTTVFLASVVFIGIYLFGISVPELVLFCGALYVFYEPVKKFAEENAMIQKGIVAAERMFEVLSKEPEVKDAPFATSLKGFNRDIEFKNVFFRYKKPWILKDLSFRVTKGQMLAVVGSTGAGKSTLAQLITRLYDPQKGEILIDSTPIKTVTQNSLRTHIAFVPQKPFFFIDSVASNISLGRTFSKEEIVEAAKLAQAHDFIMELPFGYETILEEGGKNLSGGQMQRLAIARALVRKAPILILDEATSNLDSISERKIKIALENLQGQVTQIVIAHRLTTIENADTILVLDRGKLLASGSHKELLKSCPQFKEMWQTLLTSNLHEPSEA